MQVFNSFQEMAVGTGALGAQSTMSVFNALGAVASDEITTEVYAIMDRLEGLKQRITTSGGEARIVDGVINDLYEVFGDNDIDVVGMRM